jgi:glycosyltransferase involved in cell wall biosynthesis
MNLVYVVRRFPKFSETFVLREIEELERQGETVTICALHRPRPGEPMHDGARELSARTIYLPDRGQRWASAIRAVIRSPRRALPALGWCLAWSIRHRTHKHVRAFAEAAYFAPRLPDAVDHFHAHFAHGATTVAMTLARLRGTPFSFTGHARDIFTVVKPDLLAAKVARARFVVTVSEFTRNHVVSCSRPEDAPKIVVVRNGIDRERFSARPAEPGGVPTVLAVSRLVEKKGLDTLVDACALLAVQGVAFRCEIIGDGDQRDALVKQIDAHHLDDHVVLHGSREHEYVRVALERAHIFALPARTTDDGNADGLPVAVVEALTVGVPVVSTPVAGIPEVILDGESGLLVPSDDAPALAEAMRRLIEDAELRRRVVAGGHAVATEYSLPASVAKLRGLFRDARAA